MAAGADPGYPLSHAARRFVAFVLFGPFLLAALAEVAAYGTRRRKRF